MKQLFRLIVLSLCLLGASPATAQMLDHSSWRSGDPQVRLTLSAEPSPRVFLSDLAPPLVLDTAAFSGAQYLGMFAGGTLGSAVGLLAGLAGAAVVSVIASGCIDCGGIPPLAYVIPAATSSFATSAAVASVARPPASLEFGPGLREVVQSGVFQPAILGAVAGIAAGALLGLAVDRISPADQPYGLVAFSVGQSAASVVAVRIWAARQLPD